MAVILVRDQGVGMTPEQIERLFTPFQKGGTRGTGGEASTGLGLAIVKRIVTTHGGRIDIESAAGQGTAVRVLLPLVKPLSAHGEG
jgi:two-component system, sensor histidine kinase and response regulator